MELGDRARPRGALPPRTRADKPLIFNGFIDSHDYGIDRFLPGFWRPHSAASAGWLLSSANFAAIVGLPRVSFLIVTSCALSFARRRLRSAPINASLVFCRWSMDLSIS